MKLNNLLDSGAIDFEKEYDTWSLPKDIIQALAREMEFQYSRHLVSRKDKERINRFYRIM